MATKMGWTRLSRLNGLSNNEPCSLCGEQDPELGHVCNKVPKQRWRPERDVPLPYKIGFEELVDRALEASNGG